MSRGRRQPTPPPAPARRRKPAEVILVRRPSPGPRPVNRQPPGRRHHVSPNVIFGATALALVAAVLLLGRFFAIDPVPGYFIGVNVATLALYAYDKAVAGRGRLRIPETVLHGLALLGGTLAALVSQRLFRHKVSKAAFQRVFLATALVQVALIAAWIWWSRPDSAVQPGRGRHHQGPAPTATR